MNGALQQFNDRFESHFSNEGLTNVKFFVKDKDASLSDFIEDVNNINMAIAAGNFDRIDSIDGDMPSHQFNASFY